ncbi:MAG: flippase-like domain-containing protein [Lachnospiraceae bacterium]|nr:flippase-like domain-containing protein [Lachnospiraceae bacterium]
MKSGLGYILFLIFFVIAHGAKFTRFYLVLMEEKGLRFFDVLFLYARTTLVNLLIPFKLGELYRAAAVSRMTGSPGTGISSVVVDRFFDTLALLTIILPFEAFFVRYVNPVPAVLFFIMLMLFLLYLTFAPSYRYINRYIIQTKKSERAMLTLLFLDGADKWYQYIRRLVTGRSPLILWASYIGWGAELLALRFLSLPGGRYFGISEFNAYINSIFLLGVSDISVLYRSYAALILLCFTLVLFARFLVRKKGRPHIKAKRGF